MSYSPRSNCASVCELVVNFRDACRALLPMLDRASVPWTDASHYDGWDRVAEALFQSLVVEPCLHEAAHQGLGQFLKAQRYGFGPTGERAFVNLVNDGSDCRFMRFASGHEPFDECVGMTERGETVLPVSQAEFSFVVLDRDGNRREITLIDLSL